jgi:DNA-3-methyladenine glycosylase II
MNKKILDHFKKNDALLHSYAKKIKLSELDEVSDLFFHLCDAIISQQLSVKAGNTILQRFKNFFPKGVISPEKILELSDETIRSAGLSYGKISYLKDLASKIVSKEIILENLKTMSDEDVTHELVKIKGIGPWTAEMFLMFALKRQDVFSAGDLGLRNAIQKIYNLKAKPTVEQLQEISSKWIPYRTYASRILWKSLDNT